MRHRSGKKKLNIKPDHKRSLMRNQAILFIEEGHITSTRARIKELQKFVERVVTVARKGNDFNTRRRVKALLPYKEQAVVKLIKEIAPNYVERPGGYTRVIPMGKRTSDTATIARLEWV